MTSEAFWASSVLFQVLPFPYWTYKSMSSFGLTKQLAVIPFSISVLLWKIGDAGHRARTSRMLSERSTILATSPLRKRAANDIWSLSSVNALATSPLRKRAANEQSFAFLLLHIVVKLALSMRVINPCVSHMPIACPPAWPASLVGSKGAVYVRRMSLIHSTV